MDPYESAPNQRGAERWVEPAWRQTARSIMRGIGHKSEEGRLARGWRSLAPPARGLGNPLELEHYPCDLCGGIDAKDVAVGEDFEYWTSPDSFLMVRCDSCSLVYLDPRPAVCELGRIYPDDYHAFAFDDERFGLVHRVRSGLEARRLLAWLADPGPRARIADVGCGDGFHLDLLRTGRPTWDLVGIEPDDRAAAAAASRGLRVIHSTFEEAGLGPASLDAVLLIQTIEHVPHPRQLLTAIADALRPGGRLIVVTDNVGSPDFRIFGGRHWGGHHFPRHWHLYSRDTLSATAEAAGLEVASIATIVSPVNWVYSVRNVLADLGVGDRTLRHLSLRSPVALAAGTVLDTLLSATGNGALLKAVFQRPA